MRRSLAFLLLMAGFALLAGELFIAIYAVFVLDIGGGLLTAGGAYSLYAAVGGVLVLLLGRWEDRLRQQELLLVVGYAASSFAYLGLLLVREPWHLFAVYAVFGAAEALRVPVYDSLYTRALERGREASQWGYWESLSYFVAAFGGIVGAFIADAFGFSGLFLAMLSLSLAGTFVSLYYWQTAYSAR